jgi:hypothetical protein
MAGFTIQYFIEMGRKRIAANAQLKEAAERQGNIEQVEALDRDTAEAQTTLSQLESLSAPE